MVFLSHSVIQYDANVTKTSKPMTLADEQPPTEPEEQAGLEPPLLGSYLT